MDVDGAPGDHDPHGFPAVGSARVDHRARECVSLAQVLERFGDVDLPDIGGSREVILTAVGDHRLTDRPRVIHDAVVRKVSLAGIVAFKGVHVLGHFVLVPQMLVPFVGVRMVAEDDIIRHRFPFGRDLLYLGFIVAGALEDLQVGLHFDVVLGDPRVQEGVPVGAHVGEILNRLVTQGLDTTGNHLGKC